VAASAATQTCVIPAAQNSLLSSCAFWAVIADLRCWQRITQLCTACKPAPVKQFHCCAWLVVCLVLV
jgi:hypothetical protein